MGISRHTRINDISVISSRLPWEVFTLITGFTITFAINYAAHRHRHDPLMKSRITLDADTLSSLYLDNRAYRHRHPERFTTKAPARSVDEVQGRDHSRC